MIFKALYRPTFAFALALPLGLALTACGDDEDLISDLIPDPDAGMAMADTDMGMMSTDTGVEVDMGVEPECVDNDGCSGDTPFCDTALGMCTVPPRAGAIGWGDGSADSVEYILIHQSVRAPLATDVDFNKLRPDELWIAHRELATTLPCTETQQSGCNNLWGSTTTIFQPGTDDQTEEWILDYNAWHFMRRPPALAFGENGNFATCGDARTANFLDGNADFIGPSLWTSDPAIYRNWPRSERPRGRNGTHLDMLHATPWCTGIAWETGNAYWVINGSIGSLDRYDFQDPHTDVFNDGYPQGWGGADHADGIIHRFAINTVTKVQEVPGHVVFHNGMVYVADTGGERIVRFDPAGATVSGPLIPLYDGLDPNRGGEAATFQGGTVTEIVGPGNGLQRPSGIEIRDDIIYVTDNATSQFHAFEMDGTPIRSLSLPDSMFPEGSLSGFTFDQEGRIYFVDMPDSAVYRLDPR